MRRNRGAAVTVRAAMRDDVRIPEKRLGGAQAIYMRANGVLIAGSDPRKDGAAIGY